MLAALEVADGNVYELVKRMALRAEPKRVVIAR